MTFLSSNGEKQRWQLVKEIFDGAEDLSQHQWPQYLKSRCNGDSDLRRQVEELLNLGTESGLAIDRLKVPRIASPAAPVEAAPRFEAGDIVAHHYRITRFIASGGMGEVYQAVHTGTGAAAALKCIRDLPRAAGGQYAARFRREAMLAGKIEHPNVCHVLEVIEERGGELFIAMEFLEGETLATRLARTGRMSPAEALPIAKQLCDGMEAAHLAQVLHRDLKPANILMCDDGARPVIIDFGLAAGAALSESSSLTSLGAVIGTLAYVAPEQLENGQCSVVSDVYSLGVVLYEMLTGDKPHAGKSPFRLAAEKARESHKSPDVAVPGLPRMWQEVLERCLKARPEDRLQSAAEVKALLDRGKPSANFAAARMWRKTFWPVTIAGSLVLALFVWYEIERDYTPGAEVAALFHQAERAMADASPAKTIQLMKRAVELEPKYLMTRSLLAIAYTEIEQFDEARDAVLQAAEAAGRRRFAGRGERLTLDAARALARRDFKTAALRTGQLVRLAPRTQRGYALLFQGRILEQMGRNDEAQKVFAEVLRLDPTNSSARIRHAIHLSDKERAAAEFARVEKSIDEAGVLVNENLKYDGFDENIRKCEEKLAEGDFSGAITNARSLIEAVLIGFEKDLDALAPSYEGDLVKLFKRVRKLLNLEPEREDVADSLRQVLGGLTSIVKGLAAMRNKMSDAHAASYRPSRHHAKLAVYSAATVADFQFETKNFQHHRGTLGAKAK